LHQEPAQIGTTSFGHCERHQHKLLDIALAGSKAMNKATSNGQRLVQEVTYRYNASPGGVMTDSAVLKYSGNRTSSFDYMRLGCDMIGDPAVPGHYRDSHI
jgi:hypothetical protein